MSFKVVIPARFNSSRLPGKPLLDIGGMPMIQRVYEAALKSQAEEVCIATDDERIVDAVKGFGGQVFLTSESHVSGTDRLQEVVSLAGFSNEDIIVNVQGDEPLINPILINQVAENLAKSDWASISTLCEAISDSESVFNPNAVKVVFGRNGEALYFSRAPIPWIRDEFKVEASSSENFNDEHDVKLTAKLSSETYYRHIGIYAYRASFLNEFVTWPAGELEKLESLEQLRAMENGHRIHVDSAAVAIAPGVDTQEDLELVRQFLKKTVR